MPLTHRLHLRLEESQYERLAARAQHEGRSVGSLIREAIDMAWTEPDAVRRTSVDVILGAKRMDVPDVADLKRELDDARAGRFA